MWKRVVSTFGKMYQNSFESNCFSASLHTLLPPPGWVLGLGTGRAGSRAMASWQPHSDPGNYLPCLWGSWKLLLRTQTVGKIKLELVCTEKSLVLIQSFIKIHVSCLQRPWNLAKIHENSVLWRSRKHFKLLWLCMMGSSEDYLVNFCKYFKD